VLTDTSYIASKKPAVSNVKILSTALSAYPLHGTPHRLILLLLLVLLKASVLNVVMKSSDVADHVGLMHLG